MAFVTSRDCEETVECIAKIQSAWTKNPPIQTSVGVDDPVILSNNFAFLGYSVVVQMDCKMPQLVLPVQQASLGAAIISSLLTMPMHR